MKAVFLYRSFSLYDWVKDFKYNKGTLLKIFDYVDWFLHTGEMNGPACFVFVFVFFVQNVA